jgi:protein-disulfide isomerase
MKRKSYFSAGHLLTLMALTGVLALALATVSKSSAASRSAQAGATHRAAVRAVAPLAAPVKTYGSKSAPIQFEAFTDYQCPACRALYEQALKPMISDYVASGKVYLVHHDFPLAMHQYSGQAARWANASAMIGQFGPAEEALFDNQPSWEADGNIAKWVEGAMSKTDFDRVQAIMKDCTTPAPQASTPGADPLAKSGHSCPVDGYIAPDIELGFEVPVNYTPTYIIWYKGQKLATSSNVVTWPILKQFFDSLLNQ